MLLAFHSPTRKALDFTSFLPLQVSPQHFGPVVGMYSNCAGGIDKVRASSDILPTILDDWLWGAGDASHARRQSVELTTAFGGVERNVQLRLYARMRLSVRILRTIWKLVLHPLGNARSDCRTDHIGQRSLTRKQTLRPLKAKYDLGADQ